MNLPNVNEIDIAAVKKLSHDQRDALAEKINAADPHSIFQPAGETSNPNKRKIICPICGNGSGRDATPVEATFKDGAWLYHCFKCTDFSGTLLKIIAHERNLNLSVAADFKEALAIGAALIGEIVSADNLVITHSKKHFSKPKSIIPEMPERATEYERLAEARSNLESFFTARDDWRGLRKETLARLLWGILYDFKHPSPNDKVKFAAMIIPNDCNGIFARNLSQKGYRNINPTVTTTIVNPTPDKILFVVEGAIDGASIAQATDFQHGIIATGGTSGGEMLIARLHELFPDDAPKPRIILMFDNDGVNLDDNPGQKAAAKILPKIRELGFAVVNRVICDEPRRDPNTILIKDGEDVLRERIENIIADSQDELAAVEESIKAEKSFQTEQISCVISDAVIERWQQINGVIHPE
ncbi:MAG: toprim domain-containing protein, partial [Selenomonadaceae bacterium]|nr:toprim domain-containing protein [Selenomonadaceae bacterium]